MILIWHCPYMELHLEIMQVDLGFGFRLMDVEEYPTSYIYIILYIIWSRELL